MSHAEKMKALVDAGADVVPGEMRNMGDGESMRPDGSVFVEGTPAAVEFACQAANARDSIAMAHEIAEAARAARGARNGFESGSGLELTKAVALAYAKLDALLARYTEATDG